VRLFDEFLESEFPESRRKAYYGMAIHEYLIPMRKRELELIEWTKARELAKVAGRDRQGFACAPWVHKASTMPREEFKREVDRYLTGKAQRVLCAQTQHIGIAAEIASKNVEQRTRPWQTMTPSQRYHERRSPQRADTDRARGSLSKLGGHIRSTGFTAECEPIARHGRPSLLRTLK
jgi:hypothetical protein